MMINRLNSRRTRGVRRGPAVLALLAATLTALMLAPGAAAVEFPRTVYVEEAGHTVDGLFLDAWRAYPSLLGNPISEELKVELDLDDEIRGEHIVQYYENLVLIYDSDAPTGWNVVAMPLGKEAMAADAARDRDRKLPAARTCAAGADDCIVFEQTGYSLRGGFKAFWDENGGLPYLGLPLSEEFADKDGWTTQYFERVVLRWKAGEEVAPRPLGAETAKRLKIDTTKIAKPAEVPVYSEELFQPARPPVIAGVGAEAGKGPGPQQGAWKEIVISISQQTLWAYENGELVVSTLVSTGTAEVPETVTPIGYHQVLTKYDMQTMEGTISNEYYRVEDVPDVMYFDNLGNAIHGAYWHNNFGTPMSHGCVNVPLDIAAFLYDWAPIGTAVTVIA
jgi:hypothetical protein